MGRRRTRKTVSTDKHDARASVLSRNTTRSRVVLVFASAIKSAQIHKMARPGSYPCPSFQASLTAVTLDDFDADLAGRWNGTVPESSHRDLELFGQQASRLNEPGYRESIARHGIIVVEGFNDVIGLDSLGIPAIASMSNRITEHQIEKIARWSRQLANGKVSLLFDCEQSGDDGAKEATWQFAERGINVRLVGLKRCTARHSKDVSQRASVMRSGR